jgi:hypothetical protein
MKGTVADIIKVLIIVYKSVSNHRAITTKNVPTTCTVNVL